MPRDERRSRRTSCQLLTAHVHFAIRPESHPGQLSERLRQVAVFVTWLIEQAAAVERVSRCAERRHYLCARPIEASGDTGVIRLSTGTSDYSRRRAHDHYSAHAINLRPAIDDFKRRVKQAPAWTTMF